ncbi:Hypothetical predicted protein [Podarcis lilfordi]|uniref:Uncharacterized protein n=1 Tax=Podarcis lilfordi TaxID=74358 RepID=A0AA35L653_9SAUR|nr:Hypothetical predicted protein [Podarcis lilfordi]
MIEPLLLLGQNNYAAAALQPKCTCHCCHATDDRSSTTLLLVKPAGRAELELKTLTAMTSQLVQLKVISAQV